MMKSKPFSKSSGKYVLRSLIISALLISGCTSSTSPTYIKDTIAQAIENICKNEYNFTVKAKLVDQTLWIYLPVESLAGTTLKNTHIIERFKVNDDSYQLKDGILKVNYSIRVLPGEIEYNGMSYDFNKESLEKLDQVWRALRRVLFSMDRKQEAEPQFFCIVTTDMKTGTELREIFYLQDLKKVSYEFISWGEFQHHTVTAQSTVPEAIGDTLGRYLEYRNITLEEFVLRQIKHRIGMKFRKPEVPRDSDIDKEILKIVSSTLKIYGLKSISLVELHNSITNHRLFINQKALWLKPIE